MSGRNRFDRTYIINLAEFISLCILSLNQNGEWNDRRRSGSLDSTLFPRKQWNGFYMAGLLTYSCCGRLPGFILSSGWEWIAHNIILLELTAAGLFRIYTWFPFNCFPRVRGRKPMRCKDREFICFLQGGVLFLSSWYERKRNAQRTASA